MLIPALQHKSKFNLNFFEVKEVPRCSTREDLSTDSLITNVRLILSKSV